VRQAASTASCASAWRRTLVRVGTPKESTKQADKQSATFVRSTGAVFGPARAHGPNNKGNAPKMSSIIVRSCACDLYRGTVLSWEAAREQPFLSSHLRMKGNKGYEGEEEGRSHRLDASFAEDGHCHCPWLRLWREAGDGSAGQRGSRLVMSAFLEGCTLLIGIAPSTVIL
jgi:hypothetical protein